MDSEMVESESLLATIAEETAEEITEEDQEIDSKELTKVDTSESDSTDKIDAEQVSAEKTDTENASSESNLKLTQFPLARIKHIMKMDKDVNMATQVRFNFFVDSPPPFKVLYICLMIHPFIGPEYVIQRVKLGNQGYFWG